MHSIKKEADSSVHNEKICLNRLRLIVQYNNVIDSTESEQL